jgi:hypothetical protein
LWGDEKITEGEHVFNQSVEEVVMNVAAGTVIGTV